MIAPNIKRRNKKLRNFLETLEGLAFSILPVVRFALFRLIPLVVGLAMAFLTMEYTFDITQGEFCGFTNFEIVLKDPLFWTSIKNTFILAIAWPISMAIALVCSVLLTRKLRGVNFFRTVYFLPFVCSLVAVTLMWNIIFDYNYGLVNQIIESIFGTRLNWKGDPFWFQVGLIIMIVWSSTGYKIIILTAALTTIDKAYYEAADLDGANGWQKFTKITLPAISPTMFFLLITGLINTLQEFTRSEIWSASGGPNNAGVTIVFYLYRQAFHYSNMGVASAVAWLLSILIVIITIINFVASKKWVKYD